MHANSAKVNFPVCCYEKAQAYMNQAIFSTDRQLRGHSKQKCVGETW